MKVVFFGTPQFAVPVLEALKRDAGIEVVLAVCQAAKPVGRKQEVTASPIEKRASELGIPVATPVSLKNDPAFLESLRSLHADFFVVAAYGKIIPDAVLSIPRLGSINIHPSLLPKYRGASPLQSQITDGETFTGVSIMVMDAELDHGPIIAQISDKTLPDDTALTLGERLFGKAAEILPATLADFETGRLTAIPQDHTKATLTKLLTHEDGKIDWMQSANLIDAKRRGYTPWPGIFSILPDGSELKILSGRAMSACSGFAPGAFHPHEKSFHAATADGCYELLEVQPSGGKSMPAAAFFRGHATYLQNPS